MPCSPSGPVSACIIPMTPAFAAEYAGIPTPVSAFHDDVNVTDRSTPVRARSQGRAACSTTNWEVRLASTDARNTFGDSCAGSAWVAGSSPSAPPAMPTTCARGPAASAVVTASATATSSSASTWIPR